MSRTRTSPCSPPSCPARIGSVATWSGPLLGPSSPSTSPRPTACPEPLAFALRAKGAVSFSRGHPEESFALVKHALEVALEHDLAEHASTCYFLLSDRCFRRDRYTEALGYLDESLALARKLGSRPSEWGALAERTYPLFMVGRWDEVVATTDEFTQEQVDSGGVVLGVLQTGVDVHVQRGELDAARRIFSMFSRLEQSTDVQDRSTYLAATAALRRAEGTLRGGAHRRCRHDRNGATSSAPASRASSTA